MEHIRHSDETVIHRGTWLTFHNKNGYEFVTRTKARAAAIIIAITPQREIILVEQYRMAVQSVVLELPAGLVGDDATYEKESILDAAKRELLEETGYEANTMQEVAAGPISSGLSGEAMTFCYSDTLTKRHEGGGIDDEDITVRVVKLDDIHDFIAQRKAAGLMIDPKIFIGLYFATKK